MHRAPPMAKRPSGSPQRDSRVDYVERIKEFFRRVMPLSLREPPTCTFCHYKCDPGTLISITRAEEGEPDEPVILCSVECFCDYAEGELIDNRVERAIRDERSFLHQNVCPACKRRVRRGLEEGEFETVDDE